MSLSPVHAQEVAVEKAASAMKSEVRSKAATVVSDWQHLQLFDRDAVARSGASTGRRGPLASVQRSARDD